MSCCRDCVFCGKVSERQQEACGRHDDPIAAIKACVAADMSASCPKKMTRDDVLRVARDLEKLQKQRDEQKKILGCILMLINAVGGNSNEEISDHV